MQIVVERGGARRKRNGLVELLRKLAVISRCPDAASARRRARS